MITTEVLPASDAYESLRAHWDRLFGEREREPSVSWAWSRALLRNHLARDRDWFIVVLKRDGQCEGIVPMLALREKMLGQEIITLQPIQEKYNTHSDLLLSGGADLIAAWLEQLLRLPRRWDLLNMSRLLEDSPLADLVSAELTRLGIRHRVRLEQPSYHLKLPATFEDYLAARSGKFRNYLRRAERDLAKLGAVTFDSVCGAGQLEARYEELLAVERDSWKHEHGTAISAVSRQQGFYRDLCMAAGEAGMLHLSFLRVNGEPVAYNLGLIAGGRYYYLKTSYRQQHREYGVASVGRARLIREMIGRGLQEFDFPGAPFEWEQQWTDTVRWHRSLLVYNSSLRGRALWALNGIRALARRTHGRRIVFSDPRALQAPEA